MEPTRTHAIRRFRESRTIRLAVVSPASLGCYFLIERRTIALEGLSPEILAGVGLNILGSVVFVLFWDLVIEAALRRQRGRD